MQTDPTCAALERLLFFAVQNGMIQKQDRSYHRNLLLDALGLEAPSVPADDIAYLPLSPVPMLDILVAHAVHNGVINDTPEKKEHYAARLMGLLTPHPHMVRKQFSRLYKKEGADTATGWFHKLCCDNDYIRSSELAKNVQYTAHTKAGELVITINLSKPEKDPRDIAAMRDQTLTGYPPCMLCVENSGYAGRNGYPARQNHRMVPVPLNGKRWYLQYSPYAYYNEHCIVLNRKHVPMHISKETFKRQFDFVKQYPHYFIGSNADLPIVGGSILSHDHFQGGDYVFPMDKAAVHQVYDSPDGDITADLLQWPLSCIRLQGEDPRPMIYWADTILSAWREYTDEPRGILSHTGETPHNTITPILRKCCDHYELNLVLRNNRTSDLHPLGIFHPHTQHHAIKKENIGLIETMGVFILPGRLKDELDDACLLLTGEHDIRTLHEEDRCYKHLPWLNALMEKHGLFSNRHTAHECLRQAVADVCAEVLTDCGVFKLDTEGKKGFMQFMHFIGFTQK